MSILILLFLVFLCWWPSWRTLNTKTLLFKKNFSSLHQTETSTHLPDLFYSFLHYLLTIDVLDLCNKEDQKKIRDKIETYIGRAEKLKEKLELKKKLGDYHEQIVIENNAKGYSYDRIFSRFLDENVETIDISDAYIHNVCQVQCEHLI